MCWDPDKLYMGQTVIGKVSLIKEGLKWLSFKNSRTSSNFVIYLYSLLSLS